MTQHSWIKTFTGKKFFPLDPNPNDICIEDIAHGLSNICRFGGQSKYFLSVAQHSVFVSHFCNRDSALWGLLHDAAEALGFSDIPRPVKYARGMEIYRQVETRLQKIIFRRFSLEGGCPANVHHADAAALLIEADVLMPDGASDWSPSDRRAWKVGAADNYSSYTPYAELYAEALKPPLPPLAAEQLFLGRYRELTESLTACPPPDKSIYT